MSSKSHQRPRSAGIRVQLALTKFQVFSISVSSMSSLAPVTGSLPESTWSHKQKGHDRHAYICLTPSPSPSSNIFLTNKHVSNHADYRELH